MRIKLGLELGRRYFEREVDWPAVPRVDDLVLLVGHESGWSEPVSRVWWDALDGGVLVEFRVVRDSHDEGLASDLLGAGWKEPHG